VDQFLQHFLLLVGDLPLHPLLQGLEVDHRLLHLVLQVLEGELLFGADRLVAEGVLVLAEGGADDAVRQVAVAAFVDADVQVGHLLVEDGQEGEFEGREVHI